MQATPKTLAGTILLALLALAIAGCNGNVATGVGASTTFVVKVVP